MLLTILLGLIMCLNTYLQPVYAQPGIQRDCDPYVFSQNDHVYLFYDNAVTWAEAKGNCEAAGIGGNLVTIDNELENEFVHGLFAKYASQAPAAWIGLRRLDQLHATDVTAEPIYEYRWLDLSDGSSFGVLITDESYTAWDSSDSGLQRVAMLASHAAWKSFGLTDTNPYICEFRDLCKARPCSSDEFCLLVPGGYTCGACSLCSSENKCPASHVTLPTTSTRTTAVGSTASASTSACTSTPCANGGRCAPDGGSDYTCDCAGTGYGGIRCDIASCALRNPCVNGVCVNDVAAGYSCDCNGTVFVGVHCEYNASAVDAKSSSDDDKFTIFGVDPAYLTLLAIPGFACAATACSRRRRSRLPRNNRCRLRQKTAAAAAMSKITKPVKTRKESVASKAVSEISVAGSAFSAVSSVGSAINVQSTSTIQPDENSMKTERSQ